MGRPFRGDSCCLRLSDLCRRVSTADDESVPSVCLDLRLRSVPLTGGLVFGFVLDVREPP